MQDGKPESGDRAPCIVTPQRDGVPAVDERLLARWAEARLPALVEGRDGPFEDTEDASARLKSL